MGRRTVENSILYLENVLKNILFHFRVKMTKKWPTWRKTYLELKNIKSNVLNYLLWTYFLIQKYLQLDEEKSIITLFQHFYLFF